MDKATAAVRSGTTYAVCAISNPPSSTDIHDYREVRLTALWTDPSAYSSTYEREAAFDEETWRARLSGSGKVTLVARARRPDTLEWSTEGRGEGVGCMRVIAAQSLPAGEGPEGVDPERDYFVFGMWVRPEHRRRGVGRKLLKSGLAWVLEDAAVSVGSEGAVELWLAVTATNSGAKRMYEEAGFRELPEEHIADDLPGEIWMSRKMQVNVFNE